jgi:hypothetical protein
MKRSAQTKPIIEPPASAKRKDTEEVSAACKGARLHEDLVYFDRGIPNSLEEVLQSSKKGEKN